MYEESDLVSKVRENGAADLLKVLISNFFLIITVRPRPSKISPKKRGGLPSTVMNFSVLQSSKAPSPMLVTLLGIVTLLRLLQS